VDRRALRATVAHERKRLLAFLAGQGAVKSRGSSRQAIQKFIRPRYAYVT
jgi:hypothetical protein